MRGARGLGFGRGDVVAVSRPGEGSQKDPPSIYFKAAARAAVTAIEELLVAVRAMRGVSQAKREGQTGSAGFSTVPTGGYGLGLTSAVREGARGEGSIPSVSALMGLEQRLEDLLERLRGMGVVIGGGDEGRGREEGEQPRKKGPGEGPSDLRMIGGERNVKPRSR